MRSTFRRTPVRLLLLVGGGFLLSQAASASAPERADAAQADRQTCETYDSAHSDMRIAACTRLLATPGLSPAERARALANRADAAITPDAALADIDTAVRLDPGNDDYLRARAAIHRELRDEPGAIADESEILAHHPGDLAALRARAALLMSQQRNLEAIADLDAIIAARPADGAAYDQRATARWRSLDLAANAPGKDDGFAMLQRAACRDIHADCAEVVLALADLGRAIDLLEGQGRAAALADRAQILAERGELQKALADLDDAVRLLPESARLRAERGHVRLEARDPAGALADLDEALRLAPTDGSILAARADVRFREGDLAGARADLDFALYHGTSEQGSDWRDAAVELRRKVALPGEPGMGPEVKDLKISGVSVTRETNGTESVAISLDADAAHRFATFTLMHVGSGTQVLVDGQVIAQPRIMGPITGGSLVISGRFSHDEVMALAKRLAAPGARMTVRALE
jgi:tetratricopeptide (TPR) repeat protein